MFIHLQQFHTVQFTYSCNSNYTLVILSLIHIQMCIRDRPCVNEVDHEYYWLSFSFPTGLAIKMVSCTQTQINPARNDTSRKVATSIKVSVLSISNCSFPSPLQFTFYFVSSSELGINTTLLVRQKVVLVLVAEVIRRQVFLPNLQPGNSNCFMKTAITSHLHLLILYFTA